MTKTKKRTILFSITTIIIVAVLAFAVLLANNYSKNYKGFLPLDFQAVATTSPLPNKSGLNQFLVTGDVKEFSKFTAKKPAITLEKNQLLLGALGAGFPNSGYSYKLNKLTYKGTTIYVDYQLVLPQTDKMYADVITYPSFFATINTDALPKNVPLNFIFRDATQHSSQTISHTIS